MLLFFYEASLSLLYFLCEHKGIAMHSGDGTNRVC